MAAGDQLGAHRLADPAGGARDQDGSRARHAPSPSTGSTAAQPARISATTDLSDRRRPAPTFRSAAKCGARDRVNEFTVYGVRGLYETRKCCAALRCRWAVSNEFTRHTDG